MKNPEDLYLFLPNAVRDKVGVLLDHKLACPKYPAGSAYFGMFRKPRDMVADMGIDFPRCIRVFTGDIFHCGVQIGVCGS